MALEFEPDDARSFTLPSCAFANSSNRELGLFSYLGNAVVVFKRLAIRSPMIFPT